MSPRAQVPLLPGPHATRTFRPLLKGCKRYTTSCHWVFAHMTQAKGTCLGHRQSCQFHQLVEGEGTSTHEISIKCGGVLCG